jgi:hypothetical protein
VAEQFGAVIHWTPPRKSVFVGHSVAESGFSLPSFLLNVLRRIAQGIVEQITAVISPIWPTLRNILALFLFILIGRWFAGKLFGRNRVNVTPFTAPGQAALSKHTVSIVASINQVIATQSAPRSFQYVGGTKGPVLIDSGSDLASLTNALAIVDKGKVLANIITFILQPEFSLLGSIYTAAGNADIIVRVDRRGRYFFARSKRCGIAETEDAVRDVSFEALRAIILR